MRSRIILLVEDNADDADLTVRAFERTGLTSEVVTAPDGIAALDFLQRADPRAMPEVVLLDLNLPKLDGLGVLRRVRADERTRRVPVVMLTSSNEERDILASYDLGANSFIRKPVDFAEFMELARRLALYWLVMNEPPSTLRRSSELP